MINKRIISLLPSATEILCALGLQDLLVGRSHECDYPSSIKNLPVCSSARFTSGNDSAHIDSQIKEILSEALSIYTIDKDKIKDLKPDVIITQSQCEVCAVSIKDVELTLNELVEKETKIVSLEPHVLPDILNEIQFIADQFGVGDKGRFLVEEMEDRINLIRHKLKFMEQKPKVACVEWLSPLMLAGNWTPGLIEIAGGESIMVKDGKHSEYIDFEDILTADPEVIIVMPCGFPIQRTLQEIDLLLHLPGWNDLKAVKNNKVYLADGNHYFNRPGPRIVDSIEILAEILYPKQFAFGYEGEGWLHFDLS